MLQQEIFVNLRLHSVAIEVAQGSQMSDRLADFMDLGSMILCGQWRVFDDEHTHPCHNAKKSYCHSNASLGDR
jgi:hypothetical protein